MKIFVTVDSFKGSISSKDCLEIVKKAGKEHIVDGISISDGGEGFIESLEAPLQLERDYSDVTGPAGSPIKGFYGYHKEKQIAVLEVAEAAGITKLKEGEKDPFKTTSYGVGEQILDAVLRGAKHIVIGLGGSATNDGGIGMLMALGIQFYDNSNTLLTHHSFCLHQVHRIDSTKIPQEFSDVSFTLACDVTNPLLGGNGATYVFGPQKGVAEEDLVFFEEGMECFAKAVNLHVKKECHLLPGSGAAGGIGFAFYSFFQTKYQSGLDFIVEACELEEALKGYQVLITGEGKFDAQSFSGKAPCRLAEYGKRSGLKTILICGSVEDGLTSVPEAGIDLVVPIVDSPMTLEDAISNGAVLFERAVERVLIAINLLH